MGHPRRTSSHTKQEKRKQTMSCNAPPSSSEYNVPSGPTETQTNPGMTAVSRYNYNLKVLRRRDPTIVGILDQFTHACVYHHDGQKWQKQGFEGSMFLYERNAYPPYGFYILNRMGMDDYIQHLYPEDDISEFGSYLIIKSYHEFTSRRMADIEASGILDLSDRFSSVYAVPAGLDAARKGPARIVGLWYHKEAENREPMIDVVKRLHTYIKNNMPYPEEFRYGPNRRPPPNPNARSKASRRDSTHTTNQHFGGISEVHNDSDRDDSSANESSHSHSHASTNEDTSELDRLIARITPLPAKFVSSTRSSDSSKLTVESLFASVGRSDISQNSTCTAPQVRGPVTSTGITLLDQIFASAVSNDTTSVLTTMRSTRPPSPGPRSSHVRSQDVRSHPLIPSPISPKILNQEVIYSLLGLRPSPASSAASESTSYSSRQSSNEGDNEDEGDTTTGDRCNSEPADDTGLLSTDDSVVLPTHAGPYATKSLSSKMRMGRMGGDVTPRPPLYAPDSLYVGEEEDIVELDFQDTSALSDMEQYQRALTRKKAAPHKLNGIKTQVNGHAHPPLANGAGRLDPAMAADSVVGVIGAQGGARILGRDEFAAELLNLVHVRSFVDAVWQKYISRLA